MDWSLNFGVQVVLHTQQCWQVPHSTDASEREKGLQNILSYVEQGYIRQTGSMEPLNDVPR